MSSIHNITYMGESDRVDHTKVDFLYFEFMLFILVK
jgi:hypothetical protein